MKTITIILLLFCSLNGFTNSILVHTPQELMIAVSKARPGDIILLKDKEWPDAALQLNGKGTQAKPIIIMPQTPGGVIFTGQSYLQLGGEYLIIKDLHFKNGYTPKKEVVSFRISDAILANHCRVTGIAIENYSQPARFKSDVWVTLYGKNNRIDHSTFVDKLNIGPVMIAELNDERSQQNYHSIDNNYFKGRPRLGSNGGETIRIGVSRYSLTASRTTIAHNFFEHCNGEVEIVSVKSGENRVCFNTFLACEGGLVLRHGSDNVVEGNFFLGNNKPFTGGVRIINPRQKVFNNVFYQLQGTNFRAPLSVLNGVPNSLINRYYQVKDALIERNTFINCANILFGAGKDAERTLAPENVLFKKNLIISEREEIYTDANSDKQTTPAGDKQSVPSDKKGIIFTENGLGDNYKGKTPDGFIKTKINIHHINGIALPYSSLYGAELKKLSVAKQENTGANWYHPEVKKALRKPKSTFLNANQSSLLAAVIKDAVDGDTIVLAESGFYKLKEELEIDKTLVLMAARGLKSRPIFINTSFKAMPAFISIENGGNLTIRNIAFKGNYESFAAADAGIRSTDKPMNKSYKLTIDGCEFYDYNESSNSGFSGSKSTLADSLVISNSIFHHLSGTGIDLSAEKEDKGIYNAEYTLISNCTFTNLLGPAINIYRGGNDESTLGPFVNIDHCTFNEVENREQGSAVKLVGAQQVSIRNSNFSRSGQGGRAILFQEYRWDHITVDHCNFYESGKTESFYQNVSGNHIYHIKPVYTDIEKLDLSWAGTSPASTDQFRIGVNPKSKLPAEILELNNWKLNIPEGIKTPGRSDEYKQPELQTYHNDNWFFVNKTEDAVVFRAITGGTTTAGSGYPRSELREMTDEGKKNASWSSSTGTHTLFIDQRIINLPVKKPHIVIGQIHDDKDDVIVFRLEKNKLFVKMNDENGPVLDDSYQLGKRFTVMFKVSGDQTKCYYNGKLKFTYPKAFSNAYFKAGAYVQSSCQGKRKVEGESCEAYGAVEIYKVWTKHE